MNVNSGKAQRKDAQNVPERYYSVHVISNTSEKDRKVNIAKKETYQKSYYKKQKSKTLGKICALAFAACAGVACFSIFSVGYTVQVDDTVVGTVATKHAYYEVLDEVKTEVLDIGDVEFEPGGDAHFQVEIIKRTDVTEKEELAENLKSTSQEMTEACSITQNGEFVAAVSSKEAADHILDTYLNAHASETVTAIFAQTVEANMTYVPHNAVRAEEDVYAQLLAGKCISYEVLEDETIEDIAKKHNTTEESIKSTNQLNEGESLMGKTLSIYTGEAVLSIKTVEHITGEVEIPFETVKKEDSSIYRGKTEVKVKGENGIRYVDSYVTKIDGTVTDENVLYDSVLKEPVTQVVCVGTKEPPPSVGTGEFAMPTSGKLTSPYGARWGRTHAGIDVGAASGTPIYAADNGTVTVAQFKNNGYGNFISIDHGNGFVTYYAHCSKLLVSEGDIVKKGEKIATVGSTGRSTGPHLHFEIRKDGTAKDPLLYIG